MGLALTSVASWAGFLWLGKSSSNFAPISQKPLSGFNVVTSSAAGLGDDVVFAQSGCMSNK